MNSVIIKNYEVPRGSFLTSGPQSESAPLKIIVGQFLTHHNLLVGQFLTQGLINDHLVNMLTTLVN